MTLNDWLEKNLGFAVKAVDALEGGSRAKMVIRPTTPARYSLLLGEEIETLQQAGKDAPAIVTRLRGELGG